MQQEPETRKTLRPDPPLNRHRPTSSLSQDISHVLANDFKDLFTKDAIDTKTLSNLTKTQKGRSSYHARYVEELQQAHSEYARCVKEANVLESHIIQARSQAAETESQAYERLRETMGGDCDQLGLPGVPVKSAYSRCADRDLLKMNDLISSQDFLTTQNTHVEPPVAKMMVPEMTESDLKQTFECNSDISQATRREELKETNPRPKRKDEPSPRNQAEAGKPSKAEGSTRLPTQSSLPSSQCAAGDHITHLTQSQSGEDEVCEERDGGLMADCQFSVNS